MIILPGIGIDRRSRLKSELEQLKTTSQSVYKNTTQQVGKSIRTTCRLPPNFTHSQEFAASSLDPDGLKRLLLLLIGDVAALLICAVLSWFAAASIRQVMGVEVLSEDLATSPLSIQLFFIIPATIIALSSTFLGHYTCGKAMWNELLDILKASFLAITIGLVFLYLSKEHVSRLWFISLWLCVPVVIPLVRITLKKLMMVLGFWYRPMLVIGTGSHAALASQLFENEPFMGYKAKAFVDIGSGNSNPEVPRADIVHGLISRSEIENHFGHLDVLFAMDTMEELSAQKDLIDDFICNSPVKIIVAPPLQGLSLYGADTVSFFRHENIFLNIKNNFSNAWQKIIKRAFDIAGSLLLLIMLSPVLLALYCMIRLDGGPGCYASERVGYGGRRFKCLKFRSMAVDSAAILENLLKNDETAREMWNRDFKLENDPRITKIGKFIRKCSLDELPQLWNVFIGDMSLVGPRPILPDEVDSYGTDIKYYIINRPGITGLWQVSGRNDLTYPERIELNLWYTKHWSFWNDIIILLKTIPIATRGGGAY